MALASGTRVGPYEIGSPIGAGSSWERTSIGPLTGAVAGGHWSTRTWEPARRSRSGYRQRRVKVELAVAYRSSPWQMYSKLSPPSIHDDRVSVSMVQPVVQGAVYAPGSSIVAS